MKVAAKVTLLLLLTIVSASPCFALSLQQQKQHSPLPLQRSLPATESSSATRRYVLALPFLAAVATSGSLVAPPAQALDMDAFMSQELTPSSATSAATNKELNDDEALCKFGQPSKARGDACVRAGMSTKLKKGGVDAYGNVDRGDYVRCKIVYVEDPDSPNKGFLKKTTVCK